MQYTIISLFMNDTDAIRTYKYAWQYIKDANSTNSSLLLSSQLQEV